jgi:DNA-binding CsgD family transcriptional regulator
MSEPALKIVSDRLRVVVQAADPRRQLALSRLVRDLGHEVASSADRAMVAIADGVAFEGAIPVVGLGTNDDTFRGRLPRDASAQQIDAALRAVAAGLAVGIANEEHRRFDALDDPHDPALLTPRETEVLHDVADGLTNKEIAGHLGISQHTVKFHLESMMRKLGVSSRAEAVSKSMRLKLLEPYRL